MHPGRFFQLTPATGTRRLRHHLLETNATGDGSTHRHELLVVKDVFEADLDGADTQHLSQLVHLRLSSEVTLGCTKAAEGTARQVVGVDSIGIDPHVGKLIRPGTGDRGIAQDFVAGVHISTGVADEPHLGGDQLTVASCAPFGLDEHRMTLAVAEDGLLTAPDDLDRPPHTSLGETHDS